MVPRETTSKSFKRGFQKERGFHPAPVLLVIIEDITIAEGVARREQIPCIAFVIEVEGEIPHHAIQIVALTDDIIGKIFPRSAPWHGRKNHHQCIRSKLRKPRGHLQTAGSILKSC